MDLTTATPAEIDTLLFDLEGKHAAAIDRAALYTQRAERTALAPQAEQFRSQAATAHAEAARLAAQAAPLRAEFVRRDGWTRAYLVITSGRGHVHRSTACSTCYVTTTFGLLPQVSGYTEAEIIDAAGERACTVCYPDAPVETRTKPTRLFSADEIEAQKVREARAEAKLVREEKKAAKAIGPLKVIIGGYTETVETLARAKSLLTDEYEHARWSAPDFEVVNVLATAIAAKEGKTVEQVGEEAEKRAARR